MSFKRAYLDWNATAPLRQEARTAMMQALDLAGNPSSVHGEGRKARQVIEEARSQVAALVGSHPSNVIFTSGGTEANVMALTPALEAGDDRSRCSRLLISAIEHPSVRAGGVFAPAGMADIGVTPGGVIDLDSLRDALRDGAKGSRVLVSLMLANNETGVVQPVREAAEIVHEAGGLLHVDAVQGPGRIACNINELDADLLTISAHKLGGPKGVGALVKRDGLHLAEPLIRGGGQERGARAGTENVAGIAGFGAAAKMVHALREPEAAIMTALRSRLERGLKNITPDVVIFGEAVERLPNTTLFALRGQRAETAVIGFDLAGVAVSSGAACSSGKVQPSHVLAAMGVEPLLAQAALRVSLGHSTSEADIDCLLNAWIKLSESLTKGRQTIAA